MDNAEANMDIGLNLLFEQTLIHDDLHPGTNYIEGNNNVELNRLSDRPVMSDVQMVQSQKVKTDAHDVHDVNKVNNTGEVKPYPQKDETVSEREHRVETTTEVNEINKVKEVNEDNEINEVNEQTDRKSDEQHVPGEINTIAL